MLIPVEVLKGAMQLDVKGIRDALNRNGYIEEGQSLKTATFIGMSKPGTYVYEIQFLEEDELQTGNIYVEIKQKSSIDHFNYYADF